jgi:hypothetical protein
VELNGKEAYREDDEQSQQTLAPIDGSTSACRCDFSERMPPAVALIFGKYHAS